MLKNKIENINGFTLAEVLVTLAIIGVVSALTIPAVIRSYQEKETVTRVKKFYSDINQAYNLAKIKHGPPETWGWVYNAESSEHIMDILAPYLRISKKCGVASSKGKCYTDETYKTLNLSVNWKNVNPNTYSTYSSVKLDNGFVFWLQAHNRDCGSSEGIGKLSQICGNIGVDINGERKPNAFGRDTFYFYVTKKGIVPMGVPENTLYPITTYCKIENTNNLNGYACTAWIIAKGNMDYLRRNISW